jgi:hypothetical protein
MVIPFTQKISSELSVQLTMIPLHTSAKKEDSGGAT